MPKPSKYVGVVKLVGIQSTHCVVWHSSLKKMYNCVFPDISHENPGNPHYFRFLSHIIYLFRSTYSLAGTYMSSHLT